MIERQNVLDLIGKNRNKYSSCIITCYTFDFTFFEERVMSMLRLANVKNVNVFLDGKHLAKQLENPTGNEFKTHKTYSLNPIYETGVFHPKIMLLTGIKHGLLIIGSGNLTSSGISTNDEIWGAFHLNSIDSPNAPIFASVWNYLQQFFSQVKEFNYQKLEWITQRSPWINELKTLLVNQFIKINNNFELRFVGNSNGVAYYKELINLLPSKQISTLTIISPYFDEEGKIVEQFLHDFKISKTVCITDREFGLLPIKLNDEISKNIPFYDWKDCLRDFDKRYNRLHAKIFHFAYEDGWEYLLIGSANATINALGSDTIQPKNGEAGIILRRKMQKGYIHDLGIVTENIVPIDLKSFIQKSTNLGDSVPSIKFLVNIVYSELNGNKLSVHFKAKLQNPCTLNIIDTNNVESEHVAIEANIIELKTSLKEPGEAYKISIHKDGKRISNYSLIHNVAYQSKCNPDPKYAQLSQIIESLTADPDNDQYIELLQLADYNWVDEENNTEESKSGGSSTIKQTPKDEDKNYGGITTAEFNNLNSIQSREIELLSNHSSQIADILNIISKGLIPSIKNIKESNEEGLAKQSSEEQTGTGEEVQQSYSVKTRGEQEERAIYKHLDKVKQHYTSQLNPFLKKKTFQDSPFRKLTIKDLSNISIALELFYIFYGKKYALNKAEFILNFEETNVIKYIIVSVQNNSIEESKMFFKKNVINIPEFDEKKIPDIKGKIIEFIRKHPKIIFTEYVRNIEKKYKLIRLEKTNSDHINWIYYEISASLFNNLKKELDVIDPLLIIAQAEYSTNTYFVDYVSEGVYNSKDRNGLKSYLIEMLGSFLICANSSAGYFEYPYDSVNTKLLYFRKTIFEHATFLCLNIRWRESEFLFRDSLLLDLLHFVFPQKVITDDIQIIEKELALLYEKANKKTTSFKPNLSYYLQDLLPRYIQWKETYCFNKNVLLKAISDIPLGNIMFNKNVGFISLRNSGSDYIQIEKSGFPLDNISNRFVLKILYQQPNIIIFDN
jgi:hypothetical protein